MSEAPHPVPLPEGRGLVDKDNSIAEFARASGRGFRRVKNFVQDAKGMGNKIKDRDHLRMFE